MKKEVNLEKRRLTLWAVAVPTLLVLLLLYESHSIFLRACFDVLTYRHV